MFMRQKKCIQKGWQNFADLLDDGQKEELEAKLDQVSEDYGCDVVVVTEETLDGAVPQDYADDFFDYNDYGMGEDKSGILLFDNHVRT